MQPIYRFLKTGKKYSTAEKADKHRAQMPVEIGLTIYLLFLAPPTREHMHLKQEKIKSFFSMYEESTIFMPNETLEQCI